jgi:hypothetical protein
VHDSKTTTKTLIYFHYMAYKNLNNCSGFIFAALMLQYIAMSKSRKKSIELPPKPTPPEPYECCERGCDPCVHDYYARSLARWEKRVAEIQKQQQKKSQRKMFRK